MPEETQPNPNGTEVQPTTPPPPSWFIDEGVPGIGDRPAWLPDKYKTVADMAKSNQELEKKLGTAPDQYDFSKAKFIDPDYVPFQEFAQLAKEKRVSQDVIDKMLDSVDKYLDEFSTDYAEEAKKLGDDGPQRLQQLDNWAKANLTSESYEALTSNLRSADAIKALEELRGKMMTNATQIPPGNDQGSATHTSLADLQMELQTNLAKFKSDPAYRKDLQGRMELASKNSGYLDKHGA